VINTTSPKCRTKASNNTDTELSLLPHQVTGLQFLLDHPKALLADGTGLGKTAQAIALLARLKERKALKPALVIAPAHLLGQWAGELTRWAPSLSVAAPGLQAKRKAPGRERPSGAWHCDHNDVLLLSYEAASARVDELIQLTAATVVLDEASSLKGGGREQQAIRRITRSADRVVAMTATPLENDLTETYAVLQTLHLPDLWVPAEFNQRFIRWQPAWWDGRRWIKAHPIGVVTARLPELRAYLDRYRLSRTTEEVGLAFPKRVGERFRWLAPSPAQQRALARADAMPAGLPRHQARERAANVVDGESIKVEVAIAEILASPTEKFVVWAFHKQHLDVLISRLDEAAVGWERIDGTKTVAARAKALEGFERNPGTRVLMGTNAFASGLNLQHARRMISLGCTYNPGQETQREGRIRRIGSRHATYEHLVLVGDTPQERAKVEVLCRKESDAEAVFG